MGVLVEVGDILVDRRELREYAATGALLDFVDRAGRNDPQAALEFSTGRVSGAQWLAVLTERAGGGQPAAPYTPIGIGLPLTVEVQSVYSGDTPWHTDEMLVVSGVKSAATFNASARAVNHIIKELEDRRTYGNSAFNDGCRVIYHTPALTSQESTLVSVEVMLDSFADEVLEQVSGLLKTAAGLPVFAPAQMYLLAGSVLAEAASGLVKALTSGRPFLSEDIEVGFSTPGLPPSFSQHFLIFNDRDAREFRGYKIDVVDSGTARARLAAVKNNQEYTGDAPYAVMMIDGGEREALKSFAPQLASAALLDQFYGKKDAGGAAVEAISSALQLFNDYEYRKRADSLKERIDKLPQGDATRQRLEKLRDAYVKNIGTDIMKPK